MIQETRRYLDIIASTMIVLFDLLKKASSLNWILLDDDQTAIVCWGCPLHNVHFG